MNKTPKSNSSRHRSFVDPHHIKGSRTIQLTYDLHEDCVITPKDERLELWQAGEVPPPEEMWNIYLHNVSITTTTAGTARTTRITGVTRESPLTKGGKQAINDIIHHLTLLLEAHNES